MPWLELRNDNVIFEPGWRLFESAWVPTRKENGSNWPYWSLIEKVIDGDIVFHLLKRGNERFFIGYSIADGDGFVSKGLPTEKEHAWKFSNEFYKVNLHAYTEITPHLSLSDFFRNNEIFLRRYFLDNKTGSANIKKLFYVIQNNRLQCQNGAYFSEFDTVLAKILVSSFEMKKQEPNHLISASTKAHESIGLLKTRIGHDAFSKNVKENFHGSCCYPGCDVTDNSFLVAGHIARWADNDTLRGITANGLCFCLIHDKAFEKGYFTLGDDLKIIILKQKIGNKKWLLNYLLPGEGRKIKDSSIAPLQSAILEHWQRIKYSELK